MIKNTSDTYKWIILILTFLYMIGFSFSLQFLPPLFKHIIEDVPLTDSQMGTLMGAYSIPGIIIPVIVAYMASRINKKVLINIALCIMIAGLIAFSLSNSFSILLSFRIISGIGATIVAVLSPTLITMFFDDKNIGIAMGVLNTAVPLGTVITANLFGYLGEISHWRILTVGIAVFIFMVLISNIAVLNVPRKITDEKIDKKEEKEEKSHFMIAKNKKLWAICIIWGLTNAQILGYVTFGSQYFQSIGLDLQRSSFLTSLIMLIPAVLSIPIGMLIDKFGGKKILFYIGSVLVVISFLLLTISNTSVIASILLGLGITPIPVLVFAIIPEVVELKQIGIGLGILTSIANIGMTLGPMALGFLLDNTNRNFSLGFTILSLFSVIIIIILKRLNLPNGLGSIKE